MTASALTDDGRGTVERASEASGAARRRRRRRRSVAWTPPRLLLMGLLLLVAALAATAGAATGGIFIQVGPAALQMWTMVGLYAPAALLGALALVLLTVSAVRWALYGPSGAGAVYAAEQQRLRQMLETIGQRVLVSETAKRIAYREQDLSALRETIEADVQKGHYEAALVLVEELAQTYGYREESEAYRERINAARAAEQQRRISEALARLDEVIARRDFDEAFKEAGKIRRLFPEAERVHLEAEERVQRGRDQYKQELERSFLEAAEADDVTRAMEILKELDQYLSEAEAAPLRETARGVIGKQRDNLGVQFKMAIQDKEYTQAVRVGEQIIRDFPNSRMAEEVRGMIETLRQRAAEQQRALA